MKGLLLFAFVILSVATLLILNVQNQQKNSPNGLNNKVQLSQAIISQGTIGQMPNNNSQSLTTFAGKPLENVDNDKYKNFFENAVLNEGKIFHWYRPNLTYAIDLATQRRITKSKVRRAFDHWAKKSRIFTFTETSDPSKADIFITVASASEKNRMGEAGPDQALEAGTLTIKGRSIPQYVVKHAQVTIASDFFDYDKLKEYQQAGSDQGFQTLVHELGHVLGIMGHSPIEGDCMYFQAHASGKACDDLTREVNTLAIIYGRSDILTRGFYSQKSL